MYKLTVITVAFNDRDRLEKTIQSVLKQPVKMQYVIIDGASSDGTLQMLEKYKDQIQFISEPDRGIYDAMNKGIGLAEGRGMIFMNAGDEFVGEVLGDDMPVPCFLPVKYRDPLGRYREIKIKSHKKGLPNSHQGIVFESSKKNIRYDLSYRVSSDYDFFLNYGYDRGLPVYRKSGYVHYDNAGFSKINILQRNHEIAETIYKHFGFLHSLRFRIISGTKYRIEQIINLIKKVISF